jgi:hypothetical protein
MANGLALLMSKKEEDKTQQMASDLQAGKLPEAKTIAEAQKTLGQAEKFADEPTTKAPEGEMSNGQLFARLLIGLAPQLVGAVAGRSLGIGAAAGGLAGAQAGLTGLKTAEEVEAKQKEEAKEAKKTLAENKKLENETKKLELQEAKEGRESLLALEKLGIDKSTLALKKKEIEAKVSEEKRLPASQYLAGTFARRLEQAEGVFDELEKSGFDRASISSETASLLPDRLRNDALKAQTQAERNFIESVLRRASGASITPSEFEFAEKQYFPRAGDSPSVIAQKRANRQQVMQGLKAEAGKALDQIPLVQVQMPQQQQAPSLGMKEANAAQMPSVVSRMGKDGKVYEYRLNPKTGKYE